MKKFLISGVAAFLLFSPLLVFAQAEQGGPTGSIINPSTGAVNNPSTGAVNNPVTGAVNNPGQVPDGGTSFGLQNPLNVGSICGLIKKVLGAVLALGVPVAMLFLVYGGFKFVIARGSPEGLKKARENIVHVVIGIGIFLGAWVLGQIIANTINAINPGTVSGVNSCN